MRLRRLSRRRCSALPLYAADEVKVRVAGGAVTVRGEELAIKEMGGGDVLISGTVTGVEIDRDRG